MAVKQEGVGCHKNLNDVLTVINLRQSDQAAYSRCVNVILRTLIDGVLDEKSVLSSLQGTPQILQHIWDRVVSLWGECIDAGPTAYWDEYKNPVYVGLNTRRAVTFPRPSGKSIHMMPFVMARKFADTKLPKYLKPYWDALVDRKYFLPEQHGFFIANLMETEEEGNIGYLTIEEKLVQAGCVVGQPGLRTAYQGAVKPRQLVNGTPTKVGTSGEVKGRFGQGRTTTSTVKCQAPWGQKWTEQGTKLWGGIYMAINVRDACELWNLKLSEDVVGEMGNVEHMRDMLPGRPLKVCKDMSLPFKFNHS